MDKFTPSDYWRSLILYGLNQATYKIALGKTLVRFTQQGETKVGWDSLSAEFLRQYVARLCIPDPMPQQATPSRRTVMERVVAALKNDVLSQTQAVADVGQNAFEDVIRRFHNLGTSVNFDGKFYLYDFGKSITLTDDLFRVVEESGLDVQDELDARWALLEGAFSIKCEDYQLANEVRETYIKNGYKRRSLTPNVPFLQGYQGNVCFYCGECMERSDTHVDHVLPRQVVNHDEIWNLVLAHGHCNEMKLDKLISTHFLDKLVMRNENIMGSNHPWKARISQQLGGSALHRRDKLREHYENVRRVLGERYWGGSATYSPSTDPFYRRLITLINNKGSK